MRALIAKHKRRDVLFALLGLLALMIGILTFAALFVDMALRGMGRLDLDFFTSFPSRRAGQAGILSAWVGSTLVMAVTAAFAVPLGVAAGVYLEEYARKNWVTDLIEINITNLAGVPSIVYGLLALGLFVYQFGLGQSILSAGLTLALLILPVVIVATREAIRSIARGVPINGLLFCLPAVALFAHLADSTSLSRSSSTRKVRLSSYRLWSWRTM
jgi:phosphate transport system permease protein